ncbi:protein kinase domain-containing protein [Alicyclobacillus mali (ex Roth et al. 2021)]|uniref:protein kinase domain-containing protein n=1 Tax=Alicyclobacillus mali (ex Roth et al. 2021) TaxID=1123961 RepID=UPI001A8DAC8A|nr:phosphotransferase [Alicyclobacillus mali (ex Roth et al. 2021)]
MTGSARPLAPGTWVEGKWTHRRWRIRGVLGTGANGIVYAVERDDGLPGAMKVCETAGQVAFEWSLLNLVRGPGSPFPAPQQIDDSNRAGARFFYVMERISGKPLDKVWPALAPATRKQVMICIVEGLAKLHATGHAFCDVKPQNVLVQEASGEVRFVDPGGVTPFGKAVRQFTPTTDGAFFGLCDRRAGAAYDVFAVALMAVSLDAPSPANLYDLPPEKRREWLLRAVADQVDGAWRPVWNRVLRREIRDADALRAAIAEVRVKVEQARAGQRDWTAAFMWASVASAVITTACAWALYLRII